MVLAGTVALLAILLLARWIAGWGLVTIHVRDAPLGTVIASIARQGHARIESSLDPGRKISLDVDRVPVAEALDILAPAAGASWRSAVVVAPSSTDVQVAILGLREGPTPNGWEVRYYPAPPFGQEGDAIIDPRTLEWNPEGPGLEVAGLLNEVAQKSGMMAVFPKDWVALAPGLPRREEAGRAIHRLARSVRARDAAFYYLSERQGRRQENASGEGTGAGEQAGARDSLNPDWMEQRQLARIARLPATQRAEAKQDFEEWKARREKMRNLSPEERREMVRQMMADPNLADKIVDRMLVRDSRLSAQQRINRAQNYLQRKGAARAAGMTPGAPPPPKK